MLPSAPKGPVDLHQRLKLLKLRLGKSKLRQEISCVAIQHFKIAGRATFVSHVGQLCRLFSRVRQLFLLLPEFLALVVSDQSIGNIAKCTLHRSFIKYSRFLCAGLGQPDLILDPPALEHRL